MLANSHNKAKMFLEGLHNDSTKNTFDQLKGLIEALENKSDPDPHEVHLVNHIYAFMEKLNILENNLKSYASESSNLTGSKLSSLYESISYDGSIYRD